MKKNITSFSETISEAILRTPAFKKRIHEMQLDFENAFDNKLYSKKFDYDIKNDDLVKIFHLANKWLFKNKLDINLVSIIIIENSKGHKDKGTFKLGLNNEGKHIIGIVKYTKNNFYQVVNVFLHELIHLYDSQFGPMKNEAGITIVGNVRDRQYVGNYDAHGKYFKDWCIRLNAYGFNVQEKYAIDSKKTMKKLTEKQYTDINVFFDSTDNIDDVKYQHVKAMYDRLTNCNKDMVYRDAKHWYIQID